MSQTTVQWTLVPHAQRNASVLNPCLRRSRTHPCSETHLDQTRLCPSPPKKAGLSTNRAGPKHRQEQTE